MFRPKLRTESLYEDSDAGLADRQNNSDLATCHTECGRLLAQIAANEVESMDRI